MDDGQNLTRPRQLYEAQLSNLRARVLLFPFFLVALLLSSFPLCFVLLLTAGL